MNHNHDNYGYSSRIDTDDKFRYKNVCIGIVCRISLVATGEVYIPSSAEY